MHAGGRPSKQTDEVVFLLCDAIANGLSHQDAAALAGIGERTLYEWLENEEFAATIHRAKAQQKLTLVKMMMAAPAGEWQKICWRLERLDINLCRPEVRLAFLIHEAKGDSERQLTNKEAEALRVLGYGPK